MTDSIAGAPARLPLWIEPSRLVVREVRTGQKFAEVTAEPEPACTGLFIGVPEDSDIVLRAHPGDLQRALAPVVEGGT